MLGNPEKVGNSTEQLAASESLEHEEAHALGEKIINDIGDYERPQIMSGHRLSAKKKPMP